MARIELILEYDGRHYLGWQRQDAGPSVQGAVEAALDQVVGRRDHRLAVAGRTDAGVHARGQRATFDTEDPREARRFAPALNHFLPADVRVHRARATADDFDVRRGATAKWYRYSLQLGLHASTLVRHRVWHVRKRFSLPAAQAVAATLTGERDFEAFRSVHCDAAHARRHLQVLRLTELATPPVGSLVAIDLVGNAFCRHMCRILAGTLVEVGVSELSPARVASALAHGRRADAGQTAPPQGLTLMDIAYGPWPAGWPSPQGDA